MNERTPAYWPTRILLMVGFMATGAVLALSLEAFQLAAGMFGVGRPFLGCPPTSCSARLAPPLR
jgi:hypothetical protein